jgi:diacylglycerol kinase family enzyme
MVGEASSNLKRRIGMLAYVVSALKQARSLRSKIFRADVEADGESWSGRSAMVLIGNCGSVSGGLTVFPDAEPDDGRLDVAIVTATSLRAWMSILSRMVLSRPQRADFVRRLSARHIEVRLDRPMPYELDGEIRPPTRVLDVSVEPAAVSVRAGEPSGAAPSLPTQ